MGNTVLLRPWLLDEATVGTVGSEAAGLTADNLQSDSPGKVWRASSVVPADTYAEFDLGPMPRWDHVSLLGSNLTSCRNLLKQSNVFEPASDPWVHDGLTSATINTAEVDPFGGLRATKLIEDSSTGFHGVEQEHLGYFVLGNAWTISGYFSDASDRDVGLVIELPTVFGDGASFFFNLVAGTVKSTSNNPSLTIVDYGIEAVGSGWYRCWGSAFKNDTNHSDATATVRMNPIGGSTTSYTGDGTSVLWMAGIQFEQWAGSPESTAPSDYAETTTEQGAMWRWRGSTTQAAVSASPALYDTGYVSFATESQDGRRLPSSGGLISSGLQQYRHVRLDIHDECNIDGQLDCSRLMIDEAINLGPSTPFGSELPGHQEATIERYRTQSDALVTRQHASKKTNSFALNLTSRDDVTALEETKRRQGSSRDVVLVHDPTGTHTQEGTVHGVLGSLSSPVLSKEGLWKMNISIEEL